MTQQDSVPHARGVVVKRMENLTHRYNGEPVSTRICSPCLHICSHNCGLTYQRFREAGANEQNDYISELGSTSSESSNDNAAGEAPTAVVVDEPKSFKRVRLNYKQTLHSLRLMSRLSAEPDDIFLDERLAKCEEMRKRPRIVSQRESRDLRRADSPYTQIDASVIDGEKCRDPALQVTSDELSIALYEEYCELNVQFTRREERGFSAAHQMCESMEQYRQSL